MSPSAGSDDLPLTIGIGTRNRARSIGKVLDSLLESEGPRVRVLVIDDASDDATPDVLDRRARARPEVLTVIRHPVRGGFGGSLATLLEQAEGTWLLLTSDDDILLKDNLPGLLAELVLQRPGVLVPGFIDGDRGDIRSKPTGTRIHPGKVWGTLGHAPGIVFDLEDARRHVPDLRTLLESEDPFATVYPQVVIGVNIACSGRPITHWSAPIAATGEDNPSGIRDPRDEVYWSMSSRMRQFFAFQAYLERCIEAATGQERERFREGEEWNRGKLLDFFAAWLTVEHPEHAVAVRQASSPVVARRDRLATALRLLLSGRL